MCWGASIMCICEYYINSGIAILPIITAFCLQQQQQKVLYVQTLVIERIRVYSKYTEKNAYREHGFPEKSFPQWLHGYIGTLNYSNVNLPFTA